MFESFLHNSMYSVFRWILGIKSRAELEETVETHEIEHNGYGNYEVIKPIPPPPTYKEILLKDEPPKLSLKQKQQIHNYHKYNTRSKNKKKGLGIDTSPICKLPPKLGKT